MSEQSITANLTISKPTAKQKPCKRILVQWTSQGGTSYGITRHPGQNASVPPRTQPIKSSYTDKVNDTNQYSYTVTIWDARGNSVSGDSNKSPGGSSCPAQTSSAFINDEEGNLDLLVPLGAVINEFTHETSVIDEQLWKHANILNSLEDVSGIRGIAVSLIQSFSSKLEAIAREGQVGSSIQNIKFDLLAAYESDPGAKWQGPVKVVAGDGPIDGVTGTPALIQTDYDDQDKFELLVPRGAVIDHYTHEEDTILEGLWTHVHRLNPPKDNPLIQVAAVSFMQSASDILQAVARALPAQIGAPVDDTKGFLLAYELNPKPESTAASQVIEVSDYTSVTEVTATSEYDVVSEVTETIESIPPVQTAPVIEWQGPIQFAADDGPIDHVTGSPALIQSDFDNQVKFELLVPRGAALDHYTLENSTILEGKWTHAHTLKLPADDPQAQFRAVWLLQDTSGKLEAVARIRPPQVEKSEYLVGYEFDPTTGWKGPIRLVADDGPIHVGPIKPLVDTNAPEDTKPPTGNHPPGPIA
jgi:hypothetical protein